MENPKDKVYAKINLNEGAALQLLALDGHEVIKDLHPLPYADTYASSILFPFANRVKDGIYVFNNKEFQLEANQKQENNALHGLVYNKTFKIIDKNITETSASVVLQYDELKESKGFPYTYSMQLEYVLTKKGINLKVSVKNTDAKAFPFTLGWHPYFSTSNLYKSTVEFSSTKKLVFGDRNITRDIEEVDNVGIFEVKDKQLDDCYILDSDTVVFKTPDFNLAIKASSKENFLQMYTPPKANTIAIEPTTGVSDSFNNKIGLQVLNPNESYSLNWSLEINN
tara:strand:- start:54493 stop:55338 length:846 start_codon:yes stop_codon:yes gene_type:complete